MCAICGLPHFSELPLIIPFPVFSTPGNRQRYCHDHDPHDQNGNSAQD